jgi:uncharacterized small protein (DUF1192 family)
VSYSTEAEDFDGPREARRPFAIALSECQQQMEKLSVLVREIEERVGAVRLSVPRPEIDAKAVKAARDVHSPAVDQLYNLRDNLQGLQRQLGTLLEELEV